MMNLSIEKINELRDQIYKTRKSLRMSQKELAELSGCSQSLISRFEYNGYTPNIKFLKRVINALNNNLGYNGIIFDIEDEDDNDISNKKIKSINQIMKKIIEDEINIRQAKKMTQYELARRMETLQSTISRFERGEYNPSIGFLERMAECLGAQLVITFSDLKEETKGGEE